MNVFCQNEGINQNRGRCQIQAKEILGIPRMLVEGDSLITGMHIREPPAQVGAVPRTPGMIPPGKRFVDDRLPDTTECL